MAKSRKFTMDEAEKKKDSLSYMATVKQRAAYEVPDSSQSQTLLANARKDMEASNTFKKSIEEAKERTKNK